MRETELMLTQKKEIQNKRRIDEHDHRIEQAKGNQQIQNFKER